MPLYNGEADYHSPTMVRGIILQPRRGGGLSEVDWAEIITAGSTGAANIIKANKQTAYPYSGIPGVNPVTGQFYQQQSTSILGNISSTTLILIVAAGAMVMMKR